MNEHNANLLCMYYGGVVMCTVTAPSWFDTPYYER